MKFNENLENFLDQVIERVDFTTYKKIIILDDGGYLITSANEKLPHYLNITGIEQTSAGYNRLKNNNIFFPVIKTARSWVKMKYESPIIINLALKKLEQKIAKQSFQIKKLLIMGYGTLGRCIHEALKHKYDISYFDLNPHNSSIKPNALKSMLSEFDLIIGAAGETSISRNLIPFLKKPVILASISSSDRELDAAYLRKQVKKTNNCHADLQIDEITLLNCGFPINFDHNYLQIDTDDFQLTRSLIFGSVCQAQNTRTHNSSFIELDNSFQMFLENQIKEISND